MERTRFIEHEGRAIVLMDFSNIWRIDEGLKAIEEASRFVAARPKQQALLTLVHLTDSTFDDRRPWVLPGSGVGLRGMQRVMYRLITTFSGRKLAAFDTLEDAKRWLVAQKEPPTSVPEPNP
jgi:hypothetical protein